MALGLIAGGVDALWYMLVALMFSHSGTLIRFQRSSWWLDKLFSTVLFVIASGFIIDLLERTGYSL